MNEIIDFPERKAGNSLTDPLSQMIALYPEQSPAYLEFCLARQMMVRSFGRWLRTAPPADDLRVEIATTSSILDTMVDLAKPTPPAAA